MRAGRAAVAAAAWTALSGGPAAAQQVVDLQAEDRILPAALEEVYRVGSFDGAAWETFGDVAGVAFDAAGRLHVFDRQSSRVVVVGPDGRLVREVGKAGEGPGELRTPAAFTVLRDGTIVIADLGHRAYSIFGPDGGFQRLVSFGGESGAMLRIGEIAADPRGGAVLSGGGRTVMAMTRGGPPGGGGRGAMPAPPSSRPIERIGLAGTTAEVRTIVDAWQPPPDEEPAPDVALGGMRMRMAMPGDRTFEPTLSMGPLPDGGVAYVDSTGYAVKVTRPDGSLQRVLRRAILPRPVTEAMQEAERRRRLEELESGEGPRISMMQAGPGGGQARAIPQEQVKEMMKGRIAQMRFWPELPVILDLTTGWNGKIWVVRRGTEPSQPGAIDVLTPSGQYAGTFAEGGLPLPDAFGPDGLVAFIERDEMDVPSVVVRRLPAILR